MRAGPGVSTLDVVLLLDIVRDRAMKTRVIDSSVARQGAAAD